MIVTAENGAIINNLILAEESELCNKSGTKEQRAGSPSQAATKTCTSCLAGINWKVMSKDCCVAYANIYNYS